MIGAVYVVTDATAPLGIMDQARAAAAGGACAVQLRDKTAPEDVFRQLGYALMAVL